MSEYNIYVHDILNKLNENFRKDIRNLKLMKL